MREDILKTFFVTADSSYMLKMSFGMKNSGAKSVHEKRMLLARLDNVDSVIDGIHTTTWSEHLSSLRELFDNISKISLTVRPSNCDNNYIDLA